MEYRPDFTLRFADGGILELGPRTVVMGIVNVTPDSFSGDGKHSDVPEGISLLPTLRAAGQKEIPYRNAFSQTLLGAEELYSNRAEGTKLIYDATSDRWELYNLARDPGETENLAAVRTQWPDTVLKGLENYFEYSKQTTETNRMEGEKVKLDQQSIEELKSLGYIQ